MFLLNPVHIIPRSYFAFTGTIFLSYNGGGAECRIPGKLFGIQESCSFCHLVIYSIYIYGTQWVLAPGRSVVSRPPSLFLPLTVEGEAELSYRYDTVAANVRAYEGQLLRLGREWGTGRLPCTGYSAEPRRRNDPGGKRVGKNVPGREWHVKSPVVRRDMDMWKAYRSHRWQK